MSTSIVKFHRVDLSAVPPLRGDKSALGTLPAAAFQYCEPVRTASSFGWYVFPPQDISLVWDGVDIFYADEGEWRPLSSMGLNQRFLD
jgi:hypothetical protein